MSSRLRSERDKSKIHAKKSIAFLSSMWLYRFSKTGNAAPDKAARQEQAKCS
jgi:hypothetical protein